MSIINSTLHDEELHLYTRWDFNTEALFIFILSILSIPANIFLIVYYSKKIILYRKFNKKNQYIANCYYTYLIEIISFDTVISLHLLINTIFQLLYNLDQTEYESIFDVSHFTCKFFIYALRISSAMCAWLTFLLTFNRLLLLFHVRFDRLCINTKYTTLFLFCICTIANVFRLELLHINVQEVEHADMNATDLDELDNFTKINRIINECGINTRELIFTLGDEKNLSLYWSIIIYNLIFSILPAIGNLCMSVYLIKKHRQLKSKLILNDLKQFNENLKKNNRRENSEQNFSIEFLNTCIPCITISCMYVLCYLPYTCLETLNQTFTTLILFQYTIYINYFRYLFHGCKFYLLFLMSYKFRKDILIFIRCENRVVEDEEKRQTMNGNNWPDFGEIEKCPRHCRINKSYEEIIMLSE